MVYFISEENFVSNCSTEADIYNEITALVFKVGDYWKYMFLNISPDISLECSAQEIDEIPKIPFFIKKRNFIVEPVVKCYQSIEEPKFFIKDKPINIQYDYENYLGIELFLKSPICFVDNIEQKYLFKLGKSYKVEVLSVGQNVEVSYDVSDVETKDFTLVNEEYMLKRFKKTRINVKFRKMFYDFYLKLSVYNIAKRLYGTKLYNFLYKKIGDVDDVGILDVEELEEFLQMAGLKNDN